MSPSQGPGTRVGGQVEADGGCPGQRVALALVCWVGGGPIPGECEARANRICCCGVSGKEGSRGGLC